MPNVENITVYTLRPVTLTLLEVKERILLGERND